MKAYNKPEFYVTEFAPNASVSVCTIDTNKIYNPQEITCIMSGNKETAFNDLIGGCNTELKDNTSTAFEDHGVVDYDSKSYFVWYDSSITSKPDDSQQTLFDNIMNAFFSLFKAEGYNTPSNGRGYHAGLATAEIISSQNQSN